MRPSLLCALWSVAVGVALVGCGEGAGSTPADKLATSQPQELNCSERGTVNSDGTVTSVGCAFLQQVSNIERNGTALGGSPEELLDANGTVRARVDHVCGSWLLGVDDQGQQVILNRDSGEVRSHGTLHAGEALSNLPSTLALPLRLNPQPDALHQ